MLWSVLFQLIFGFWILRKMDELKKQTAGLQGMSCYWFEEGAWWFVVWFGSGLDLSVWVARVWCSSSPSTLGAYCSESSHE